MLETSRKKHILRFRFHLFAFLLFASGFVWFVINSKGYVQCDIEESDHLCGFQSNSAQLKDSIIWTVDYIDGKILPWKTYHNQKYGFSLKFPFRYQLKQSPDRVEIFRPRPTRSGRIIAGGCPDYDFYFYAVTGGSLIEELNNNPPRTRIYNIEDRNGIRLYKHFDPSIYNSGTTSISIPGNLAAWTYDWDNDENTRDAYCFSSTVIIDGIGDRAYRKTVLLFGDKSGWNDVQIGRQIAESLVFEK